MLKKLKNKNKNIHKKWLSTIKRNKINYLTILIYYLNNFLIFY